MSDAFRARLAAKGEAPGGAKLPKTLSAEQTEAIEADLEKAIAEAEARGERWWTEAGDAEEAGG